MIFETGTYTGNGTSQTINLNEIAGVPDLVIVKGNTTQKAVLKTTAGFASNESDVLTSTGDSTNSITALGSGSFDVGNNAVVNTNAVTYQYTAFYNDGGGDFAVGSYTGDGGTGTRDIATGLANLECVWVLEAGSTDERFKPLSLGAAMSLGFDTTGGVNDWIEDITTTPGTFVVDETNFNVTSTVYRWIAFNTVSGKIDSISYTGNGSDNRQITVDAVPEFVIIKSNGNRSCRWRAEESGRGHSGDSAGLFREFANGADVIQGFGSTYVEVGTSNNANNNAETYQLFWLTSNPYAPPSGGNRRRRVFLCGRAA